MRKYQLIAACLGWGAKIRGCESGPEVIAQLFKKKNVDITEIEWLYPKIKAKEQELPLSQSLPLIYDFNLMLYESVRKAIKQGYIPIVLGGDHSIAVATWNAFREPFGLLWIDAHMDAHIPEDSPSGAYHGMPVRALMGQGAPQMVHFVKDRKPLQPENLAYIGVRSFEKEEADFLKERGVRVYFIEEVQRRGLKTIIPEAIDHITRNVDRYGVSFDLDVFDVEEAPGVGSPEKNGIRQEEILPLLHLFGEDPRFMGFELVEYNPERDIDYKTAELSYKILNEVMR